MAKYKKYTLISPQGRKLMVIKAKKLKSVKRVDTMGFRPICEHGVEL